MTIFEENSYGEGPGFQFTPLTQTNRNDIVNLSSNFNINGAAYVDANTLELSALGAFTDLLGQWNSTESTLVGWHHIAVTGRDVYVKIVTRGYLFPFGHLATIIAIYERVIEADPGKTTAASYADAYVGSKFYIRPLQLTKTYPAIGQPWPTSNLLGTNDFPFQSIRLTTLTSPEIDPIQTELVGGGKLNLGSQPAYLGPNAQAIEITAGGSPVQWSFVAIDPVGNELHLQVPMVFVYGFDELSPNQGLVSEFQDWSTAISHNPSGNAAWVNAYNALTPSYRTAQGNGQLLRFSPEAGGPSGGTTHPLVTITFGASRPSADPYGSSPPTSPPTIQTLQQHGQPAFYPTLASAAVRLKAADALSANPNGFNDASGTGVGIEFFPQYVVTGLPEQDPPSVPLNGVYAQMTQAAASAGSAAGPLLSFPSNLVGGLGNPNLAMAGLSSITGPVGGALSDLSNYANSAFATAKDQVNSYFNSLASEATSLLPQLFGSLKLTDILGSFLDDLSGGLSGGIPNLTVTQGPGTGEVTVTYHLMANLDSGPSGAVVFVPNTDAPNPDPGVFELIATAFISPTKPPTYSVQGSITPFTIYLVTQDTLGFIQVPFNSFSFSGQTGSKTKVQVSVGSVTFIGALSFVNALEQFLSDIGGSGLSINVTPTEVDASFSISLPPIDLGTLDLSGISFSAGVKVPFLGDPALVTFGFASQDNPFTITVMMFGGGGFLQLGLGFAGVQTVQASFEFEGQFALDLGVASGGISLQAGIYYSYAAPGQPNAGTTLTGFVKLTGQLCILGIITVTAELDLTLTYVQNANGHYCQGTATLKISIKILFFSITVPITVTKVFSGSNSAPQGSQARILRDQVHPELNPATTVPVYFDDIVLNQLVWQEYCNAFSD